MLEYSSISILANIDDVLVCQFFTRDDIAFLGSAPTKPENIPRHIWTNSEARYSDYESVLAEAVAKSRKTLLIAGDNQHHHLFVFSMLALGAGFHVYLCKDLITASSDSVLNDLCSRLRQQGALIVTLAQMQAEFRVSAERVGS